MENLPFFNPPRTERLLSVRHTAAHPGGKHCSSQCSCGWWWWAWEPTRTGRVSYTGAWGPGRWVVEEIFTWTFHQEEGITCAQRYRPEAYKEQLRAFWWFCFSQFSLFLFSFVCLPPPRPAPNCLRQENRLEICFRQQKHLKEISLGVGEH